MCVCLRSYLHPFKVKFPSELAPSPHPQLLGSQAGGRAGTPVPAAVGLLPSRCLGGPCSRSLASICFGDSLWPGGSAGRRAVVWVGVGAYPGRWSCPAAGRPPGPGPGPSCPPPPSPTPEVGFRMCSASEDGRKEATLRCRGSWSHSGSKQRAGAGLLLRPSAKIGSARPCFPFHGTKWEAGAGETSDQWSGP